MIKFIIHLSCISFCLFTLLSCDSKTQEPPTPTTMHPVIDTNNDSPQRIKDLTALAYALEAYKKDNNQYPISSNQGQGYDGLYADTKYGQSKEDWIPGLAPKYIGKLPIDPRGDTDIYHSYIYISNGANYKLVSQRPEDCQKVKQQYPKLIDPRRDCYAYGYWTLKAEKW